MDKKMGRLGELTIAGMRLIFEIVRIDIYSIIS